MTTEKHMAVAVPASPMLALAGKMVESGQISELEKLLEMHREWERDQARNAYNEAFAAFRADPPQIYKDKEVRYSSTRYKHATLDHVASAIGKAMAPHGLSFRWETKQDGSAITVTCWINHVAGHREGTTLSAPADTSGQKNAIQAIGSAVTYLQRYSLLAATGLAASDDDDGAGTTDPKITEEQADDLRALAEEVGADWAKFLRYLGVAEASHLPAKRLHDAIAALEAKRK
jgi:hypothetical protein